MGGGYGMLWDAPGDALFCISLLRFLLKAWANRPRDPQSAYSVPSLKYMLEAEGNISWDP